MKAIIFNSGLGKRMGDLTSNCPKSMVKLENGETIFERQLRILNSCGIRDFIITTGPFEEKLRAVVEQFPDCKFTLVPNPIYDKTNCIYSMYLARNYIDSDSLVLHGDLVFNEELVREMLEDFHPSICLYNEEKPLPEKDFKGRIENGLLKQISVKINDENCYAFQPLYKFSKEDLYRWKEEVAKFVENGIVSVYAEDALNELLTTMEVHAKSYKDHYIDEIDTKEDLERVSSEIDEFEKRMIKKR